jgi:hypothetical protein
MSPALFEVDWVCLGCHRRTTTFISSTVEDIAKLLVTCRVCRASAPITEVAQALNQATEYEPHSPEANPGRPKV